LFSVQATGPSQAVIPAFSPRLAAGVVSSRLPLLSPKPHARFQPTATNGSIIGRVDDAPRPTSDDPVDTIATVQYSGWNQSNLAKFAAANRFADPLTSGQYTQVSVDRASVSRDNGGSDEVALDQESLLETSPHSSFRAYFVGESTKDTVDAFNQIASDAVANHIVALSDSWGNCEPEISPAALAAMNTALKDLAIARVTVFSGSGDSGAYDCSEPGDADDGLAVDFPPSDPYVVAVGGTSVDARNLAAPVQHTWWTASGRSRPHYLGQGSGGGFSTRFAKPKYQAHVATSSRHRAVPDISLEADPASGFAITNHGTTEGGNGGTSLAGPLAAATLTNTLEVNGVGGGLGNILPRLYGAPAADFSDITVGSNGHYQAHSGYDEATGLGAPLWNKLAPALLPFSVAVPSVARSHTVGVTVALTNPGSYVGWYDSTGTAPSTCPPTLGPPGPPTAVLAPSDGTQEVWVIGQESTTTCSIAAALVTVDTVAPVARVSAHLTSASRGLVAVQWSATDAAPSSGIGHYAVTISRANGSDVFYRQPALTSHSVRFTGDRGVRYLVTVRAVDKAGNVSATASVKVRA
jgi:hypothetical protein